MEEGKIKEIVYFIRENSSNGKFTKYEDLYLEPISLTEENITEAIEALKLDPEYSDVVSRQGKEHIYLYSNIRMSENYANMVFRVEEKDLLKLLVETVRYESKTYPRPTGISLFSGSPFNFNGEQVQGFLKQVAEKDEYSDIEQTKASNGSIYLYSTKHMVKDLAEALTEWIEVGQYESP